MFFQVLFVKFLLCVSEYARAAVLAAPFFMLLSVDSGFLPEIHKYHTRDICAFKNRTAPIGRTLVRSWAGKE